MPRTNEAVAELLYELADLLSISGGDRFKIRAYENAARAVAGHHEDVASLSTEALQRIPSVGRATAAKIAEYVRTGSIARLDELRREVPTGMRPLLDVPGLGPRRALDLHRDLGISTVEELRAACEQGAVRDIPGFGERTETKLLQSIAGMAVTSQRIHLGAATAVAEEVTELLARLPAVSRIEVAGSLRRMRDTIGDVDVLVASDAPRPVMEAFAGMPAAGEILARGETKTSVRTRKGVQIDLRVVPPASWGAALIYFTGSKAHNVKLRERAVRMGLKLSEYGLDRVDDGRRVAGATEEEVYAALGLPWISPTLREDRGEIEAAAAGGLPVVVGLDDIRGDLHGHTDLTDGTATLDRMVEAALRRGYEYYAVTDHAPLMRMQAMTPDAIAGQRRRIRRITRDGGISVLHGSELNIRPDGSLDWDAEVLDGFDVLVASVHSHFGLDRTAMTRRLVAAIEHPAVNVIGHPTTRRIGRRPPIDFDADEVFRAAARSGTALEINCHPERLDLSDELVRAARAYGVKFAISTDSHATAHLEFMRFGVATAQRAWLGTDDVVNSWPLPRLREFLAKGRAR